MESSANYKKNQIKVALLRIWNNEFPYYDKIENRKLFALLNERSMNNCSKNIRFWYLQKTAHFAIGFGKWESLLGMA